MRTCRYEERGSVAKEITNKVGNLYASLHAVMETYLESAQASNDAKGRRGGGDTRQFRKASSY